MVRTSERASIDGWGVKAVNAMSQLGWSPEYADLREGLRDYIDRYRTFVQAGESLASGAGGQATP